MFRILMDIQQEKNSLNLYDKNSIYKKRIGFDIRDLNIINVSAIRQTY
jgi:hypothetical protein